MTSVANLVTSPSEVNQTDMQWLELKDSCDHNDHTQFCHYAFIIVDVQVCCDWVDQGNAWV